MAETRIAPRHRVIKPAKIEYGGYKMPCTIRDLSITGAAIEVSDQREIPATFTLIMPDDGLKLPCHVSGAEISESASRSIRPPLLAPI